MKRMRRGVATLAATSVAALAGAGPADAGVATYASTDVPKNIGHTQTVNSLLSIPAGRTAIGSLEVTNYGYSWPASGQELSAQLIAPDGTSMFLFEIGCFDSPPDASFTLTDSAASFLPEKNGCDDINLVGTSFKPVDPQNKKLSIFNGKSPAGAWTLRSVDNGISFQNQGSLRRWSLRVTHVPPKLTADAPATANVAKPIFVTATADATGRLVTGGGAVAATTPLTAGAQTQVRIRPTAAVLKKVRKRGKARMDVSLTFTDETGGTATSNVAVTVKGKRKKPKKKAS